MPPDHETSDPNATISIDSLGPQDEVTLDDPGAAQHERSLPPPLPPSPTPASAPAALAASSREPARTVLYLGVFALLLAGAIAAGLFVGLRARRDAGAVASSSSSAAAAPLATAAAPATLNAAPSATVMTLPPVDVR